MTDKCTPGGMERHWAWHHIAASIFISRIALARACISITPLLRASSSCPAACLPDYLLLEVLLAYIAVPSYSMQQTLSSSQALNSCSAHSLIELYTAALTVMWEALPLTAPGTKPGAEADIGDHLPLLAAGTKAVALALIPLVELPPMCMSSRVWREWCICLAGLMSSFAIAVRICQADIAVPLAEQACPHIQTVLHLGSLRTGFKNL